MATNAIIINRWLYTFFVTTTVENVLSNKEMVISTVKNERNATMRISNDISTNNCSIIFKADAPVTRRKFISRARVKVVLISIFR